MATLAEHMSTISFDEVPNARLPSCKAFVGSSTSEDAHVKAWYYQAIGWCDQKLSSRNFTDADGESIAPPDGCIMAVYLFVRTMREIMGRPLGVVMVRTGQRQEQYAAGLGHGGIGAGGSGAVAAAGAQAWPALEPYAPDVTLFSSGS